MRPSALTSEIWKTSPTSNTREHRTISNGLMLVVVRTGESMHSPLLSTVRQKLQPNLDLVRKLSLFAHSKQLLFKRLIKIPIRHCQLCLQIRWKFSMDWGRPWSKVRIANIELSGAKFTPIGSITSLRFHSSTRIALSTFSMIMTAVRSSTSNSMSRVASSSMESMISVTPLKLHKS